MHVKSTAVVCNRSFKRSHVKPLSCKSKCNKFVGFKPSEVYVACYDFSLGQVRSVFIAVK